MLREAASPNSATSVTAGAWRLRRGAPGCPGVDPLDAAGAPESNGLAAARPARVRSWIRSRSSWPSAPKIWKMSRPRPWCTDQGCGRNDPYPVLGSCDAGGLRASQLQHAVQDLDRHVHLSRPTLIRTRAQPVPDHALEPAHGGLGPGARVVARGLLPAHPARLGDELQVAVPLRRRGLGRGAGHGGRARRNDDVRARVALGHGGVNALLVVRAVRRDGGDRVLDLVQQGADWEAS